MNAAGSFTATDPHADAVQLRAFLDLHVAPFLGGPYADGLIEIAFDVPAGSGSIRGAQLFGLAEVLTAVRFAVAKNAVGHNLYISPMLKKPTTPQGKRSSAHHFHAAAIIPYEADMDAAAVNRRIAEIGKPLAQINTGTIPELRIQGALGLAGLCVDHASYQAAFHALNGHIGGDKDAQGELMRLPHTVSYPPRKKLARGYAVELTTAALDPDAQTVGIEQLMALEPLSGGGDRTPRSKRPDRPRGEGATDADQPDEVARPGSMQRALLLGELREALRYIPPDKPEFIPPGRPGDQSGGGRDLWVRIAGQGLKWLGEDGYDLWIPWSKLSSRFDQAEADKEWASLQPHSITWRSVLFEAKKRGWRSAANGDEGLDMGGEQTGAGMHAGRANGGAGPQDDRYEWETDAEATATEPVDPWAQYLTPAFPLDTLPPKVRDFVRLKALSMGTDASALAMAVLAAASGAISHSFRLAMVPEDDWFVRARLWVALVNRVSGKKTPAMNAATDPLKAKQRGIEERYAKDVASWKAAKKTAKKSGEPEPDEPPPPLELLADDTTVEALGEILAQQDRGILVVRDELSGWISSMDRYRNGKSTDRAFWVEAYNGGSKPIRRIGRGRLYVEVCSVSLLGTIQDDMLDELRALAKDGLLQRFLPVMMRPPERETTVFGVKAATRVYADLIYELIELNPRPHPSLPPLTLTLEDAALAAAGDIRGHLHDLTQTEGLGKGFLAFLGKLAGVHGSLMLILHFLTHGKEAPYEPVDAATAVAAARIIREFVIPHGWALYRDTGADGADWDELRAIGSYILTSGKTRFTLSDFTAGVPRVRGLDAWKLGNKLSVLVTLGWLFEEEGRSGTRIKAWNIPAGLRERYAERLKSEAERKARAQAAIREFARGRA
jgi:hypothetical protein